MNRELSITNCELEVARLHSPLTINRSQFTIIQVRGFGTMLEPRYIFRAKAFDQ